MPNPESVIAQVITVDDAIPTALVAPVESTALTVYPKTMGLGWQFRTKATRPWVRLLDGSSYTFGEDVSRPGGTVYQIGDTATEILLPSGGPATAEIFALWRPRWLE